jgi:hypothetical protein
VTEVHLVSRFDLPGSRTDFDSRISLSGQLRVRAPSSDAADCQMSPRVAQKPTMTLLTFARQTRQSFHRDGIIRRSWNYFQMPVAWVLRIEPTTWQTRKA